MMVNFKTFFSLALFLLGAQLAMAQFTATGTVVDDAGEPLIGATVQVQGTVTGAVTDLDGRFSIQVNGDQATLLISYTGYESQEVTVTSASPNVTVTMTSSAEQLSEVIVTGYGSTRREALTGSVTSLRSESIEQVPLASVEQTLQGNVAGLQAVVGNGQPGANANIQIRGRGSISASSDPLFVIDGIPVISGSLTNNTQTSNPLASLNPNDIESVNVLKDAAATAIYGSRAANGVILITTKSGKAGKAKINLRTQVGFNDWAVSEDKRLRGLTAEEYTHMYIEGYLNRGDNIPAIINRFNSQFPDPQTGLPAVDIIDQGNGNYSLGEIRVDTRWLDELTRTGINQSYDLSVSGGTDAITYYASGSYFKQEAPVIGSDLDRFSSRLNLAVKATDKLRITNNLTVSETTQNGMNDGTRWANPLYNGYLMAPVLPIRDEQGRFYAGHANFFMGGNNPVGSLSGDDTQTWTITRVLDNLSASYELADGLTFKSAWAFDLLNFREFYYKNGRYGDGRNDNGQGYETLRNAINWIGTQTLNYGTTFGDSHNFDALVGYEAQKNSQRSVVAGAIGYPPNPDLRTLNNAANPDAAGSSLTEFAFSSVFGQVSYNYNYKYYLSGSLRRDGSSRFGAEERYGTFWSVGASWNIHEEDFLAGAGWLDQLKLRTSYGVTGNAGIGNYEAIPTFGYSGFEYDGQPGGGPSNIGNTFLTWEQSKAFNVGVDFDAFGFVNGTVEYFDRESDNLLLDVPISRTTGFSALTQNFGAMRNSGIELTLNFNVVNTSDFKWDIGGNASWITNQITRLNEDYIDGTKIREEGSDFQTYYIYQWAGVDPQTGDPLWYTDETLTETTSSTTEAALIKTGATATPDVFGGLTTNLSYKGFFLDAQFNYSFGGSIYDLTAWVLQGDGRFTPRSQTNLVLDRWRQPGDITDVPKFEWGNRSGSNLRPSSRWLFDGSYIRLRNFTVGYNLPASVTQRLRFSSARVYMRGVNMWTWTEDKDLYLDPETAFTGNVNSPVPNLATISFGLDIGF